MKQLNISTLNNIFDNYEDILKDIQFKKIISATLLFMGIAFICSGLWKGYKNKINPSWSLINGIVVNSVMESCTVPSNNNKNINNTYYNSKITFKYDVNGNTHRKSTTVGGVSKNDPTIVQKTISNYPEGQPVAIFYNPDHPEESLIKTFSASKKWFPIICGLILVVLGLMNTFFSKTGNLVIIPPSGRGKNNIQKPRQKSINKTIPQETPKKNVPKINGKWKLNYQIPSMVEMISIAKNSSGNVKFGDKILSAGSDAIMLTINDGKMIFNFNTKDPMSNCKILSVYQLIEDKLMLDNQIIDFRQIDIEGFPPKYYTYSHKGSTLVLKTNKIKGLGNRQISYHFSKS